MCVGVCGGLDPRLGAGRNEELCGVGSGVRGDEDIPGSGASLWSDGLCNDGEPLPPYRGLRDEL